MTRNKDLKRLVRARMGKTGESYTTSLVSISPRTPPNERVSTAAGETPKTPKVTSSTTAYAELAGTADATIKEKTGCTWERWVAALDALGRSEDEPPRHRGTRRQQIQDRGLVGAGGDGRLRAHQRFAGARAAPRRYVRSEQVTDVRGAGGRPVRSVGRQPRPSSLARR